MPRSLAQYVVECLIAYLGAAIAAFPLEVAIIAPLDWVLHIHTSRTLLFLLTTPVLGAFWLSAAVAAALVYWGSHSRPDGLFRATRAGEWVWVAGTVYIVLALLSYLPVSHHWARTAVYELFASTDDIGNLATAPFYMGIAYSLTRHLLRVRGERRAAQGGLEAGGPARYDA